MSAGAVSGASASTGARPGASRLAPPLARRIDRLARAAHLFHRFAHHPLCGEYAGEVIAIGRRARLCRGCALATLGALAGVAAGIFLAPEPLLAAPAIGLAAALALLRTRRGGKVLTRLLPAALLAFAIGAGMRAPTLAGDLVAIAALAGAGLLLLLYRRRGPDRSPCASCPERLASTPCRGYAAIVRRERAFQRLSGAWLRGAGM